MLVQFTVKNYKCFKEEAKLSMVTSNYDKDTHWRDNVVSFPKFHLNLLKSAVIYGANASGKTKILEAMDTMRICLSLSSIPSFGNVTMSLLSENIAFQLSTETENQPTLFEIIFIKNNEMYRYGFEISSDKIISEWLYHKPATKEVELFYRDGDEIEIHPTKFKKGKILIDNDTVKSNVLFLAVTSLINDEVSNTVSNYLNELKIIEGLTNSYADLSAKVILKKGEQKNELIQFIQNADFNIEDIMPSVNDEEDYFRYVRPPNPPAGATRIPPTRKSKQDEELIIEDILVSHKKYNELNQRVGNVTFSLENDESEGTKKFFAFSALILKVIKEGGLLIVDELDSKIHPNLTEKIVRLFNSKEINKNNAQLIFNTHNTNLLSADIFRRDQIWFTKKDRYGASTIYSLGNFKDVRNDDNFQNKYSFGRYGATPYLSELGDSLVAEDKTEYAK